MLISVNLNTELDVETIENNVSKIVKINSCYLDLIGEVLTKELLDNTDEMTGGECE
jgi:hypothetical protein